MTPTEALFRELVDLGCDQARALTLINAATMQWAAAPKARRSRHAEAQARYWAKQQAKRSDMIRYDQDDQQQKEGPQTPKEKLTPVTSLRSVTGSPRTELFGRGAGWLSEITGKPVTSCKSLIGRWLKTVNDEAWKVLAAIDQAKDDQMIDPVAWISASLTPKKTKSRDTAYAALDRIDAAANLYNQSENRLALGSPTGETLPHNQQRDDGGNDSLNGFDIHPLPRKPVARDLQPIDGDAFQF